MAEGPFLMGAEMTVPDIILTHCEVWARTAKFPIAEPKLAAYLQRMQARPAFLRATARCASGKRAVGARDSAGRVSASARPPRCAGAA